MVDSLIRWKMRAKRSASTLALVSHATKDGEPMSASANCFCLQFRDLLSPSSVPEHQFDDCFHRQRKHNALEMNELYHHPTQCNETTRSVASTLPAIRWLSFIPRQDHSFRESRRVLEHRARDFSMRFLLVSRENNQQNSNLIEPKVDDCF